MEKASRRYCISSSTFINNKLVRDPMIMVPLDVLDRKCAPRSLDLYSGLTVH
jgi:hypothetical protein